MTEPSDARLMGAIDPSRAVLRVSGPDAETFLQGLLTNEMDLATAKSTAYAALLTPQGKFLYDTFIMRPDPKQFLLDIDAGDLEAFQKRLTMYKLRAQLEIARASAYKTLVIWPAEAPPHPSTQGAAEEAHENAATLLNDALTPARQIGLAARDPRHPALGLRILVESSRAADAEGLAKIGAVPARLDQYNARRVRLGVPVAGDDIVREETFPLEIGLDRIGGVDFRKGCYVGQEVSARMKHKAVLKKALYFVDVADAPSASPGDEVLLGEKTAGVIGSVEGGLSLALLRVDRAEGALTTESGDTAKVIGPVFGA